MTTTFDIIAPGIIDARGDLIVGASNDAPVRVPVGADGQVLTADSTQAAGVRWTTPTAGSGSGGGGGAGGTALQSTVWYFPGVVSTRVSGAALIVPPIGGFELVGASVSVQTVGSSTMTGGTVVRFTAEGSPIGSITLAPGSQQTRGWYKTSTDSAKQIFAATPTLSPESLIRCEILAIPGGSGTLPQNLSAQLWWRAAG